MRHSTLPKNGKYKIRAKMHTENIDMKNGHDYIGAGFLNISDNTINLHIDFNKGQLKKHFRGNFSSDPQVSFELNSIIDYTDRILIAKLHHENGYNQLIGSMIRKNGLNELEVDFIVAVIIKKLHDKKIRTNK